MLKPFQDILSLLRYLQRARRNMIEAWPKSYFRRLLIPVRCPGRTMYILNDPDDIQHVMVTQFRNYRKSPTTNQVLKPLLRNSMFITEGENWSRNRKIMTPAFHKSLLEGYARIMAESGQELLESWSSVPEGGEVELTREMTCVTADVVARAMFSFLLREQVEELYQAFVQYQASHGRVHISELLGLPSWLPRPGMIKGRRAVRRFDAIILKIMEARKRSDNPPDDLLSLLFAFRDPSEAPLSPELIRDEMATIFLAGHETTATTLMWALYLLDAHPAVQDQVVAEVETVLQGRTPAWEDVEKLVQTKAVFEETLRLYPPVHVYSRQALGPDTLPSGQAIRKRDLITIPAYILHRHEAHWENPHEFMPERFLPENAEKIRRYAYLPFGAGPRLCLGKFFGLAEGVILLAIILQKYRLTLRPGHTVKPLGRMTLRPEQGLPMQLHPRSLPQAEADR